MWLMQRLPLPPLDGTVRVTTFSHLECEKTQGSKWEVYVKSSAHQGNEANVTIPLKIPEHSQGFVSGIDYRSVLSDFLFFSFFFLRTEVYALSG